jgi:hypothetical protein
MMTIGPIASVEDAGPAGIVGRVSRRSEGVCPPTYPQIEIAPVPMVENR